jgi:type II secretory pathway predicted ATPase ExeA
MLIEHLLDQLDRSNVLAANLVTPNLAAEDLLSHILSAFRIEAAGAGKAAEIEAFEDFLFDQMNHGKRVLLLVDEAQNLPLKTLEELRVLSNLDYDGTPLFQVFLIGQPDFRETMARADMEQLRQRVIATYHLQPMSRAETEKYIEHRLGFVGWDGDPKITSDAYDALYAATGGLPRKIHKLCNRMLLFCAVEKLHQADGRTIASILSDMSTEQTTAAPAEATDLDFNAGAKVANDAVIEPAPVEPPSAEPEMAPVEAAEIPEPVEEETAAVETPPVAAALSDVAAEIATAAKTPANTFDRLRAARKAEIAPDAAIDRDAVKAPKAATLDDVANAIEAARLSKPDPNAFDDSNGDARDVEASDVVGDLAVEAPTVVDPQDGWKKTVVLSINDTRDELKRAHQSVIKLRRQLTEIDRKRRKRRVQIAASLERAETLLADVQNAWR